MSDFPVPDWATPATAMLLVNLATGQAEQRLMIQPDRPYVPAPGYALQEDDGRVIPVEYEVPPAPPADEVTMFQMRVALHRAGLLAGVQAAVQAVGGEALIAWEYANVVRRESPLVQAVAGQIGLTAAEMDALWAQAAAVQG